MFRRHYPIVLAIVIFFAALGGCLALSLGQNQGHLVYALDDPYIHMAIAKNFVKHGIWGVTAHGFTSSASSLLWPLLLSVVYFLFGVNEWFPFILNIIFAAAVCLLSYFIFRRCKIPDHIILAGLTAIIFFTSLPSLTFCGQEHILHLLITIIFVYLSAEILAEGKFNDRKYLLVLMLSPLLTMSRYEGIFLILIVAGLFIAQRDFLRALFLTASGLLPLFVYGLFSVTQGWYFFPNSVLLKGNVPVISSISGILEFFSVFLNNFCMAPHVFVLVIGALVVYIARANRQKGFWENRQLMIFLFVASVFLHMQFARIGGFYRYEAYLVGLGIFILTILLYEYFSATDKARSWYRWDPAGTAWLLLCCILAVPLIRQGLVAVVKIPAATHNIYEQQYQVGLFVKRFYPGKAIVLNDIGAVNYLADIDLLDLWGLGTIETTRLKVQNKFTAENIEDLVKGKKADIAIIYDDWFYRYDKMLTDWIKIGRWIIPNNVICGSDTVSFYAVNPREKDNLIKNLKTFSSCLPKDVIQLGEYIIKK